MFSRPSPAVPALILAATLLGLSTACGGGADKWTGTQRDSAGITIVDNTDQGIWDAAETPALTEVVRIGSAAGDSLYQFGVIVSADIATDGSIYVLDGLSRTVRVYDAAGKHQRTIGRPGTGPGEFQAATTLILGPGDTLLVPDMGKRTVSRLAPDGTPGASLPLQLSDGIPFKWVELADGRVAVQMRLMNIPGAATVTEPKDLIVLRAPDGKPVDTLLTMPSGETMQFGGPGQMRMRLLSPEPMWTVGDNGDVYNGLNSEYSVRYHDESGAVKRIIRRPVPVRAVSEDDKTALRKLMRDAMVNQGAPEATVDMLLGRLEFAPNFPAIGNLLVGPKNTLWVQRIQTTEELQAAGGAFNPQDMGSRKWDVYDEMGRFLGIVQLPQRYQPLRWVGDRLLGVQRDENDVQFLSVLKLG